MEIFEGRDKMVQELTKISDYISGRPDMSDADAAALGAVSLLGQILIQLMEIKIILAHKR